jgi:hypothetical protein
VVVEIGGDEGKKKKKSKGENERKNRKRREGEASRFSTGTIMTH